MQSLGGVGAVNVVLGEVWVETGLAAPLPPLVGAGAVLTPRGPQEAWNAEFLHLANPTA